MNFSKKDFKFGDIIKTRNNYEYIYIPSEKKFYNFNSNGYIVLDDINDKLKCNKVEDLDIMKVERYIKKQTLNKDYTLIILYEREEEILDKEEKEYLTRIITPFRSRVKCIMKRENSQLKEYQYIKIEVKSINKNRGIETIVFPYFTNKSMYKRMEIDNPYTLKELEL